MSEQRFYVKKVTRDERPKLFSSVGADYKYFIVERVKRSWGEYGGNFLFNFGVDYAFAEKVCNLLNEQQDTIEKQERIIKSQDAEISRQYNLCLAMSGILREEFGVYDVFDRTKDKNIKKEE